MSFTAFNAPIQQKPPPAKVKPAGEDLVAKNIDEAFHDAPAALITKLKGLGSQGMFTRLPICPSMIPDCLQFNSECIGRVGRAEVRRIMSLRNKD